jgi:hypothetical protein
MAAPKGEMKVLYSIEPRSLKKRWVSLALYPSYR